MSEAARIEVERSPLRCPYCHADVDPAGDAWVACAGCLARHHDACWVEGAACGACGGVDALARATGAIRPRPERVDAKAVAAAPASRPWFAAGSALVAALVCAVALVLATSVPVVVQEGLTPPAPPVVVVERVVEAPPRVEPARDWTAEPVDPLSSLHASSGYALVQVLGDHAGKHAGTVTAAEWLPGGRQLVSASHDGTVRVWDASTLRELALPVARLRGSVSTMALTPDGRSALIACEDLALRLVDLSSGRELRTLRGHAAGVTAVSVSPDGRSAASGDYDGPVRLWDLTTGRQTASAVTARCAYDLAFTPDGKAVLAGSPGGATLIDVATGSALRRLEGHTDRVQSVAISRDGATAVTGSQDKTVRVWDLASGRCQAVLEGHDSEVQEIAISPDGRLALTCSIQDDLRLWDLRAGALRKVLPGHRGGFVRSVAFSEDGLRAVSGGSDHAVRVWDVETGVEAVDVAGHRGPVTQVHVAADGRRLATSSVDETVRVWDAGSGRELRATRVDAYRALSVALSPDGRTVAAGGAAGLAFVDVESGRVTRLAAPERHWIEGLAFTADGARLWAWPRHERLRAFDVASGEELLTPLATGEVLRGPLALAPDGRLALAQVADRSVQLIDLETYERRTLLLGNDEGIHAAFALTADGPDGARALTATSPHHLRTWHARTLERLCVSSGQAEPVRIVALRGDGELAASAGGQAVLLWELAHGQLVDRIDLGSGHDQVTALTFSGDGATLYVGTARGVVLVLARR